MEDIWDIKATLNIAKQLSFVSAAVAAIIAMLFVVACSNDIPSPAPVVEQVPQHTSTPERLVTDETASDTQSECQVGQVLAPQDRCTYPGTSDDFWVDESGVGHFLFFTASSVINAQNANINNQPYDFSTRKQADGSWIIEIAGVPSDSVRVSDLIAVARDVPTPTVAPAPRQVVTPAQHSPAVAVSSPIPAPQHAAAASTPVPALQVSTAVPTSTSTPAPMPEPSPTPTPPGPTEVVTVLPHSTPIPPVIKPTTSATPALTPFSDNTPAPAPADTLKVVADMGDYPISVGESLVLDATQAFSDFQSDGEVRYSAIFSNTAVAQGRINSVTGQLNVAAIKEGSSWIALRVCDVQRCSALGDVTIHVKVLPFPNQPPQAVSGIEDQQVQVGKVVSADISSAFWDLEGDRIVGYRLLLDNEDLAEGVVHTSNRSISLIGSQVGSSAVSVIACDSGGCGTEESALHFTLNVMPPPNQPPVATGSIADQEIQLGEIIVLDVSSLFSDPEGDPIREYGFAQTDKSVAVGKMESQTGSLMLRGAETGTTTIAVDASDGSIASIRPDLKFRLTVTEPPRNPPSVVGAISDQTVKLGKSVEVPVARAFDAPDRYRIIRYDFLLKDPEVGEDSEITRAGVLTLSGAEEGKSWVSVRACSYVGCSEFSDLTFVLIVDDPDKELNKSPEVVGGLPDRRLVVGESVTMDVSKAFSDPDDDPIVDYKCELSRPYYAIGSSITDTGVLKLHASNVGTTTVSISACDDENECSDLDDMSFTLTVEAALSKLQTDTGNTHR